MTLHNGLAFLDEEDRQVIITSISATGGVIEFIREYTRGRFTKDATRTETFINHCNSGRLRPLFRTRDPEPVYGIYQPKTIVINL